MEDIILKAHSFMKSTTIPAMFIAPSTNVDDEEIETIEMFVDA
jgi:hypothetical protein